MNPCTAAPAISPRRASWILFALALGGAAIGVSEFTIMGLMPEIAGDFGVDEPTVGHLISAYAVGVVVGAPLLAILGARLPRRLLLVLLMGFFAVGNIASALAPNYPTEMVMRFISGLPHGAYFGVASLVAAALVPPNKRASAVGRVLLGLTLAMLIGNPLATAMGQYLSWRVAFALVGVIAISSLVLVQLLMPRQSSQGGVSASHELRSFNSTQVWLSLGISAIGFAGMFCVFSYLAPTMLNVTQVGEGWIPVALAAFGLGATVGTVVGGKLFDRLGFGAIPRLLAWSALVLLLFPLAAHALWSILIASFAVGSMVSLSPALQTHLMDIATEAQTLASAANQAAFNVANAIGPMFGGLAISAGLGWTSTGYVGCAMALIGLAIYALAVRLDHPRGAVTA